MKKLFIIPLLLLSVWVGHAQVLAEWNLDGSDSVTSTTLGYYVTIDGVQYSPHTQSASYSKWRRIASLTDPVLTDAGWYPVTSSQMGDSLWHAYMNTSLCSADNGFMLMTMQDQIAEWGGDGNRGAFHCAIEFPSISTEGLERVELELYQYYRKFNRDQCFLDYRIDGGAWHAYEINVRDVDVNVNDVLCGKVSYILPSAVTNQSNVQFRLRWYCNSNAGGAYGYIWAVDDVKIKNVNIFPVTVASGQTLYFRQTKFTAPFEAEVINPVLNNIDSSWSPEGSLTVPSMVSYQGVDYVVSGIAPSAFGDCKALTEVTIPNTVTKIENSVFRNDSTLTSINLPNTITSIGDNAFYHCTSLTGITLPESVTSIGEHAFDYDTSLASINLPNSITSIGDYAFGICISLTNIDLPDAITSIKCYTFYCCEALTSIEIPATVTRIEYGAFSNCYNLSSVYSRNPIAPALDDGWPEQGFPYVFGDYYYSDGLYNIPTIYIPCGSADSYNGVWSRYRDYLVEIGAYTQHLQSADASMGYVEPLTSACSSDTITFQAVASEGYHFTQWNDGDTNNPRTYIQTQDTTFIAEFAINMYNISAICSDTTLGTVLNAGLYSHGAYVALEAQPTECARFVEWSDGDSNPVKEFLVYEDYELTAIFENVPRYGSDTAVACGQYQWHDSLYVASIETSDTIRSYQGCDSIVSLSLTINPVYHQEETLALCDNQVPYQYGDSLLTGAGVYDVLFSTVETCDSLITLTVNVNPTYRGSDEMELCQSQMPLLYGDSTFEASTLSGVYDVTFSSVNSCDSVIALNLTVRPSENTQLKYVTIQDNRNKVVWTKDIPVQQYQIYREGSISGQYEMVARLPFEAEPEWIDSTSAPQSHSYRYKITSVDSCGIESELSQEHKTMHLTISQGINNSWNLVWTEYEGTEYSSYRIYRGNTSSDLTLIDEIAAGGNTTYTDAEAPEGTISYQVEILLSEPSSAKALQFIKSNIASNNPVSIADIDDDLVEITSQNGIIRIENAECRSVQILDVAGRVIYTEDNVEELNYEISQTGVYFVKVGNLKAEKVVVVK